MLPLDAPWYVEQGVLLITPCIITAGAIVTTLITHRRSSNRLTKIEATSTATAAQVTNSHTTNLRDDITELRTAVEVYHKETSADIASLRHKFNGHVKDMAAEQASQSSEIRQIRTTQQQQLETVAANREAANIAHNGMYRRLSLVEHAIERAGRWKSVWPWKAQNIE